MQRIGIIVVAVVKGDGQNRVSLRLRIRYVIAIMRGADQQLIKLGKGRFVNRTAVISDRFAFLAGDIEGVSVSSCLNRYF